MASVHRTRVLVSRVVLACVVVGFAVLLGGGCGKSDESTERSAAPAPTSTATSSAALPEDRHFEEGDLYRYPVVSADGRWKASSTEGHDGPIMTVTGPDGAKASVLGALPVSFSPDANYLLFQARRDRLADGLYVMTLVDPLPWRRLTNLNIPAGAALSEGYIPTPYAEVAWNGHSVTYEFDGTPEIPAQTVQIDVGSGAVNRRLR